MAYKWYDDASGWNHATNFNTKEHLSKGKSHLKSYGNSTYFYDDQNDGKPRKTPTALQIKHNALHLTGLQYEKPSNIRKPSAHAQYAFNDLDTDQFVAAYGREMRNSGDGDITNQFLNNFMNEKSFRTGENKKGDLENEAMQAFWKGDASKHLEGIYNAHKIKGPKYDEKTGEKLERKPFKQSFTGWSKGETIRSMDIRRAVGEHLGLDREKEGELSYHSQVSDFMKNANETFSNTQAQSEEKKNDTSASATKQPNEPFVMSDSMASNLAYTQARKKNPGSDGYGTRVFEKYVSKYKQPGKNNLNKLLGSNNETYWGQA